MLKQLRPAGRSGVQLWDEHWRTYDGVQHDALSLRWDGILDLVDRRVPIGRTLEAGCGLGKYVLYAAERRARIVGIDFVPQAVAAIRSRRPDAKVAVADLGRLPFPDRSFDTVLCLGVLEHFERGASEYVDELVRVLAPGGWLLVTVPYANLLKRRRARRPGTDVVAADGTAPEGHSFYQYCYSRSEARALVAAGGLDVIHDRRIARLFWLMGRRTAAPRVSPANRRSATAGPRPPGRPPLPRLVARETAFVLQHLIPPDLTAHMIAVVGRKPPLNAGTER